MDDIQVYLLQSSSPAIPRGLIAKSSGARTPGAYQQSMRTSDLLRELDNFIAARHPKKAKVRLNFGKATRSVKPLNHRALSEYELSEWSD